MACKHVREFRVLSSFDLGHKKLLEQIDVVVALLFVFIVLFIKLFTLLHINCIFSLHRLNRLLRYLPELLKLLVDVLLNLISLGQKHLPLSDVVDGLIVVRNQVSLDERAIAHE